MINKINIGDTVKLKSWLGHSGEVTKIVGDRVTFTMSKDVTLDYTEYDGEIITSDLEMECNVDDVLKI